ncbi:MAG: hypothetical protein ACFE9N_15400 [Promethearchaeota archaeon]
MSIFKLKFRYKGYLLTQFILILAILMSVDQYKSQINQNISQVIINASPNRYKVTSGYPYNWIDASSGTELILGDDNSVITPLPFNFTFYDGQFNEIYITTEGYLTFTSSGVRLVPTIPSSHPHEQNIIAPYWVNLEGNSGQIYIKNFSSYWVAAWRNFNLDNGSFTGSFEAVLYNNGDIVFNYDVLENVSSYACGLNYGDGDNYSVYTELASGVNDFSIKFSPITDVGGNGVSDNNLIYIIVGVVVTLGAVSTAGGITFYYYKKNPEQFKAKLRRGKAKIKEGTSKLKEKVSKDKKRIKQKTPKND